MAVCNVCGEELEDIPMNQSKSRVAIQAAKEIGIPVVELEIQAILGESGEDDLCH